ncbi:hypothetical protein [Streptomyces sp. NPDC096311]|uniref:hypothetical protein n=1 Tax=Streptomyces sp. NPDC096311 TaxID=3366083 RepID=UPI00380FCBC8
MWFQRTLYLFLVSMAILFGFSTAITGTKNPPSATSQKYSWDDLNSLVVYAGLVITCLTALVAFHFTMRYIAFLVADLGAIRRCFVVFEEAYQIVKGSGSILSLDDLAKKFSDELSSFARAKWGSAPQEQYRNVTLHITAVQHELRKVTDDVLMRGTEALPQFVRVHKHVLDRLIDERWMSLLDVPNSTEPSPSLIDPVDTKRDRRDSWIIILGAAAAALVIALGAAVGVQPTVSIPAALVFLMGPAALWGSKRLGIGPRDFMGSLRSSYSGGTQDASSSQQPQGGPASPGSI